MWRANLARLYGQIAQYGPSVGAKLACVVDSAAQLPAHREAQAAARVRVPLLLLVRDSNAPIGADGQPHANVSALVAGASAVDGWSASVRVLDAPLRSAARRLSRPIAVWTVDDEAALRRAWLHGADDVVSNKPRWARRMLGRWRATEC